MTPRGAANLGLVFWIPTGRFERRLTLALLRGARQYDCRIVLRFDFGLRVALAPLAMHLTQFARCECSTLTPLCAEFQEISRSRQ